MWNPDLTIGQAVNLMKIYYLANPFYFTEDGRFYTFGYGTIRHSQVSQYNLFGDPALHIVQPSNILNVDVNHPSVLPGDTVRIKVKSLPQNAHLVLEITDDENYKVFESEGDVSGETYELPFAIPDDIAGQILTVNVFARGTQASAHGQARIAVGRPLVRSIVTNPALPQVGDSISFKITVQAKDDPVETMSIVNLMDVDGYQNYTQVIPLQKVNDSLFQSIEPFSGFSTGGKKLFDIRMITQSGKSVSEHWKKLFIKDPRPDILIVPNSVTWGGQKNVQLCFKVKNNSGIPVPTVNLACYDDKVKVGQAFAKREISLKADEEKQVHIDLPANVPYAPYHQIKIVADPDSLIAERNENNNTVQTTLFLNYLQADPTIGTSLDGRTHQKITLANTWQLEIVKGGLPEKSVFRFGEVFIRNALQKTHQYDLQPIPTKTNGDTTALNLQFLNPKVEHKLSATLSVPIDTVRLNGLDKEHVSIYRYDSTSNAWLAQKSSWINARTIRAHISSSGLFAVFYSKDRQKPMLEITVNGRPLLSGMLVPKQPTMGILLQDANGVDFRNAVDLKIDNTFYIRNGTVVNEGVSFPENARSAKNIQITLSPDLKSGSHELVVKAADVNGNLAEKELTFSVTQNFNLIVYGNYPNPFKDQTIISYTIESNEPIDELSVKIYTTSGRLIRSKMLDLDETVPDDNILEPNYHELIWDGTDDDGNPVANGVYFAIIKGKYKNKVVKHVLKMARLQ